MRFDDHFIDELKTRLKPSDVIGKSVKLQRRGREWVGLSPFTKEKTPSFYVNDHKGFYHDFSSGKHGDIISFLQETERLSFNEAIEALARQAGMSLPVMTPQAREAEIKSRSLIDILEMGAKWYQARLFDKTPEAAICRAYLEKRGLVEADIRRFGLGYAPKDRTALKDALLQKGASTQELLDCGLLIAPEGGGQSYDRFRERLMFPIADAKNRLVSFGGRALNPDDKAKYLNGPETSVFHKGHMLYGLPEALKIMGAESHKAALIVVEGYMDVLACQRAGLAAVAPLGTALTEDQIDLLWRRHAEPVLCFDGDKAGQRAAYRALDRALPKLVPGKSLRVSFLPEGQDPDDLLRQQGSMALRAAVEVTHPFVEVLFKREVEQDPLDTPEAKAGLKKRLRALAAQIADRDLSEAYRDDLLGRFDTLFKAAPRPPYEPLTSRPKNSGKNPRFGNGRFDPPALSTQEGKQAAHALKGALDPIAAALTLGLLEHPDWALDHLEALDQFGIGDEALNALTKAVVSLSFAHSDLDKAALYRHLEKQGFSALVGDILKAAHKSRVPFLSTDLQIADAHTGWLKAFDAVTRLTGLERALNSAKDQVGTEFYSRTKIERDALRRALKSGQIWIDEAEKT